MEAFREASKFGNKQAQKVINQLIETKAGWWEWWFSDVQTGTYLWKIPNRYLFLGLFILLHLCPLFYYLHNPGTTWIKLAYLGIGLLFIVPLLFISPKALLGIVLIEILIVMLISPLVVLFSGRFVRVSIKYFSEIWQIWIATIVLLALLLLHRNIVRVKTPFGGEIEMPRSKAKPEPSMTEPSHERLKPRT